MDSWRDLTDDDLTCPYCEKKFPGLSQLRSHMRWSEHNKNDDGEYFSPTQQKLGWKTTRTYAVRISYALCTLCRPRLQCGDHLQVRTTRVHHAQAMRTSLVFVGTAQSRRGRSLPRSRARTTSTATSASARPALPPRCSTPRSTPSSSPWAPHLQRLMHAPFRQPKKQKLDVRHAYRSRTTRRLVVRMSYA